MILKCCDQQRMRITHVVIAAVGLHGQQGFLNEILGLVARMAPSPTGVQEAAEFLLQMSHHCELSSRSASVINPTSHRTRGFLVPESAARGMRWTPRIDLFGPVITVRCPEAALLPLVSPFVRNGSVRLVLEEAQNSYVDAEHLR